MNLLVSSMTLLTLKASLVQFIAQTELALLELPSKLKKNRRWEQRKKQDQTEKIVSYFSDTPLSSSQPVQNYYTNHRQPVLEITHPSLVID